MNASGSLDAIGAVEACYATAATDRDWLGGVLEALASLDNGNGLYANVFDASDLERVRVDIVSAWNPSESWLERADEAHRSGPQGLIRALYDRPPPVALASQQARRLSPALRANVGLVAEATDVLGIFAAEADGRGVMIGIPTASGPPPPRTRALLACVAAHLVSARRLRGALSAKEPSGPDTADAVLAPSGKVLQADGAASGATARAALADSVRRVERARGRARRVDAVEAVGLWQGLVRGEWSLVDHVESDGRRFVLARRNPPPVHDPKALSERERHVSAYVARGLSNKYVGYLLGLAPSTVASHLANAARKLGVTSRQELIRALAQPGGE
jgi:DNA-binding CsgD family transcriptional regulator